MPREGEASGTILVRPAVPADAPALARLNRRARAAAMPWLREPRTEVEVAAWLAGPLMARHHVLVASAPPGPVGYIGFGDTPLGPTVFDLYLDPAWQRRGLGRRLLREAIAAYPAASLSLRCFAANATARAFYEGLGFHAAGTGGGADNEEGAPDVLLVRSATADPTTSTGEPA